MTKKYSCLPSKLRLKFIIIYHLFMGKSIIKGPCHCFAFMNMGIFVINQTIMKKQIWLAEKGYF